MSNVPIAKYKTSIWDLAGFSIIIMGLLTWYISQNEMIITGLNWLMPPIGNQLKWTAENLELVIPIGIFIIVAEPRPTQLLVGAGIALTAGIILWLAGF